MGKEHSRVNGIIRLYSSQMPPVLEAIKRDGACMSKAAYVKKKYQESAGSFLPVYEWFAKEAAKIVPRPEGAELPYWAFENLYSIDASGPEDHVLTLDVPAGQVVLFDMFDWTKLMRFEYLGESKEEETEFKEQLRECGLKEYDVMMSRFYPEWKQKILESWKRLFRHHEALLAGDRSGVGSVQAALWKIDKEWIENYKAISSL